MIIDAHVHVHPQAHGLGERRDASAETFLKALDASPLEVVVLLPIEPFISNDFVFEVAARRPGRIVCFGSVDFRRGLPCVEELEELAETRPIHGLKLHPRRQGLSEKDFPVVKALVSKATDLELPVLIDSFPHGKGVLTDGTLELIAALSDSLPKARLIIAHMGGIRILEALILARTSYNIFFDISLIFSVYRGSHIEEDIFYAVRRLGAERCLYGSDYPDVGLTEAYQDLRQAFEQRGFTDEQQEWIFGKAAAQLLRINEGGFP